MSEGTQWNLGFALFMVTTLVLVMGFWIWVDKRSSIWDQSPNWGLTDDNAADQRSYSAWRLRYLRGATKAWHVGVIACAILWVSYVVLVALS